MRTRNLSGGTQWNYDAQGDNDSLFDPMRRMSVMTDYSTATAHVDDQESGQQFLGNGAFIGQQGQPQHGGQQFMQQGQQLQLAPNQNQQIGQFNQQTLLSDNFVNNQQFGFNQRMQTGNAFTGQQQGQFNQQILHPSNQQQALVTDIPILEHGVPTLIAEPLPWERQAVFSDDRPVMNWERPMMMNEQMSLGGQAANAHQGARRRSQGFPQEPALPASAFRYQSYSPNEDTISL
jgi:hypothetical protein